MRRPTDVKGHSVGCEDSTSSLSGSGTSALLEVHIATLRCWKSCKKLLLYVFGSGAGSLAFSWFSIFHQVWGLLVSFRLSHVTSICRKPHWGRLTLLAVKRQPSWECRKRISVVRALTWVGSLCWRSFTISTFQWSLSSPTSSSP